MTNADRYDHEHRKCEPHRLTIINRYRAGMSLAQIAAQTRYGKEKVRSILVEEGFAIRKQGGGDRKKLICAHCGKEYPPRARTHHAHKSNLCGSMCGYKQSRAAGVSFRLPPKFKGSAKI